MNRRNSVVNPKSEALKSKSRFKKRGSSLVEQIQITKAQNAKGYESNLENLGLNLDIF